MSLPTRRDLLSLAWPIVLAQAATALTGIVDTAVMGRFGTRFDLAAVAVAAVTFSFLYWAFGFLRMATTGLTARARGAGDHPEARAVLLRAVGLGATLGVALVALHPVTRVVTLALFDTEAAVDPLVLGYLDARILGAPAALTGFALTGWLLGQGRTRELLVLQVVLNGTNAVLDSLFVGWMNWGPAGIGMGTAIAEWVAVFVGLWMVRESVREPAVILDRARLTELFTANRDILIRTVALLSAFAWFVQSGTRQSTAAVAGNQVLLQFIAVSAFVLDAFAFLTEKEAGEALGGGDPKRLFHVTRITTELALFFGAVFCLTYLVTGPWILRTFIADEAARTVALQFLPWCAAVPLLGVPAWQLDGLFLGTTRGRALRNAAVASTIVYIAVDVALRPMGNTGVWWAFISTYALRAGFLSLGLPGLLRDLPPAPRGS